MCNGLLVTCWLIKKTYLFCCTLPSGIIKTEWKFGELDWCASFKALYRSVEKLTVHYVIRQKLLKGIQTQLLELYDDQLVPTDTGHLPSDSWNMLAFNFRGQGRYCCS